MIGGIRATNHQIGLYLLERGKEQEALQLFERNLELCERKKI